MAQELANSAAFGWWLWQRRTKGSVFESQTMIAYSTAAVLVAAWCLIFSMKKPKLKLPPGPKGLPLVGNLLSLDPELSTYFAKLAQIYGPIFSLKLGRKTGIVISSPSLAEEVLKYQDITFANRDVPAAAREVTYGGLDIVWTPYGPEWRMLRKVCVREMLSSSTLESVYSLRRKELRQTITYLYRQAGSPVNVGEQMFLTVMNVITSMMWGGTIKGEARENLAADFRQLVTEITVLLGMANLSDFYPELARFDLQGVVKKMSGLALRFDGIFESIIGDRLRKESDKESKDFLQVLLRLKDEGEDKVSFTINHLKALLMDMVVGGTETTSNTVEFALAELMKKPQALEKLRLELDTVVGKDNIVEETHISRLPYLNAVLKETLRLHPALPLLVPHCPSSATAIAGYHIPKGARVFINVWAIHRDPKKWESPSDFRPDRFLDGKWDFSGHDFSYIPFGSGRRICAGIVMAERMVMYSLASLVHSFDWSLLPGENVDLSEQFGIVLKKKTPLVAVPTPRLSGHAMYE